MPVGGVCVLVEVGRGKRVVSLVHLGGDVDEVVALALGLLGGRGSAGGGARALGHLEEGVELGVLHLDEGLGGGDGSDGGEDGGVEDAGGLGRDSLLDRRDRPRTVDQLVASLGDDEVGRVGQELRPDGSVFGQLVAGPVVEYVIS